MTIARNEIEDYFSRYQDLFNASLAGEDVVADIASLYADEFIGAAPQGVRAAKRDAEFEAVLGQGYEHYRAIGTTNMTVTAVDVHDIDDLHCIARVDWDSTYRKDGGEIRVPFQVSYLVQQQGDELKVFGWITGDEQALLEKSGVI